MGGSSFDLIAQELLKHRNIMDQMERENREVRHQLAELRAGYGFYVEIDGQRFPLSLEAIASPHISTTPSRPSPTEPLIEEQIEAQPTMEFLQQPSVAEQNKIARQTQQLVMNDAPEAQPMSILPVQTQEETGQEEQKSAATSPTFLEEVMLDEFTVATTSPLSVWSAPKQEQQHEISEDEELELLRKQLIGSYLLE